MAGPPTLNRKGRNVKRDIRCEDGDQACDLDGARDGQCTFGVALCFGNDDPRYPLCQPSMVRSVEVKYREPKPSKGQLERLNAARLESAVAALGLEVRRRKQAIHQFAPSASDITPICGSLVRLVAPAPKTGRRGAVRKTFKLHAASVDGRRDTDRFALVCE